ncbi:Endoglucanase E-5 precursor [Streptomyces sp. ADI98-10]|nr:Endoglucanase E-5 precursor [Streptomyces sp. ADI98-10]
MVSRTHRRTTATRTRAIGAVVAAAVTGGTVLALTGTAQAAAIGAAYTRTSAWDGGYTGQYVVTNETDRPPTDWTLEFDLPAGTKIGSLRNGEHTVKDDRACPGGPKPEADATCGSIDQEPLAFSKAFAAYE